MKDFTQQNRREFLDKVTKLGMLSFLPVSPFLSKNEKAITTKSSQLLEVGPYIQNLTSEGITVMWTTTRNTFSWVEYGQSYYLHKKAFEYAGGLIQANNRIHRVRIQPLDPGVKLKYRVLLIHISPWHSGNWHGTLHCREMFGELLNRANIDVQISGHTHRYKYHEPDDDHNFPIFIGGGPQKGSRTMIKLQANQEQMKIEMWGDSGELAKEAILPFKS